MARAGFRHDTVVELDRDAVSTLTRNRDSNVEHVRHWNIQQVDARSLDYGQFKHVDVISGGPPCQPFSIGGKHLGPKDPRNMWPEAIRAIREARPKAFVLENVRGLFRPDFTPYLQYITLQLSYPNLAPKPDEFWEDHLARLRQHDASDGEHSKSYRVVARAINAADYGAAQKRHRAIFVGIGVEISSEWSFPEATHSQEALAWAKHVDLSYWKKHEARRLIAPASQSEAFALKRALNASEPPSKLPWQTVRDAISDLPAPTKSENISGHWQHPGARAYANHTGSCYDEPAKALKAGDHGVPGGENMLVNRQGNVRYFTVREMARLQDFPDEYYISGSWKAATRQLGNAVPAGVAEYIGNAVRRIIAADSAPV